MIGVKSVKTLTHKKNNLTTPFEECDFTKSLIDCIELRVKIKNK